MASKKHIEAVEAVNNATTETAHREAQVYLQGFREGMRDAGLEPDLIGCDMYYIDKGIDRPMCCGVFLDWSAK